MTKVALVLAGLLAGTVGGTLLMPRVRAETPRPPPAPLQKWQQFCEPAGSINEASALASARGVDGWELVGFFGGALCFKRPLPDPPKPNPPRAADPSWPGNQDGI